MRVARSLRLGANLRANCFAIGYLNLIASLIDIGCHVVIVFIVTNGFQCDVSKESLRAVQWNWLEPVLVIINLGTHGFYPFPLIFHYYNKIPIDYLPIADKEPACYPGMLHLHIVDILYFLINAVWLKFVLTFVAGVHKKDPEPMRMFFVVSIVKLGIQLLNLCFQPDFENVLAVTAFKLTDICIATLFLVIINKYIIFLRNEKARKTADQPPSYIECLVNGPTTRVDEKKDTVFVIEEKKPELKEGVEPQPC
ncbi:uncharacterized protein LOC123876706 [Maniola jurtina]|uniref:uncharacterized protein LOC123876706 n=1 Tax=Maniola jurtina TaxID=191418 RepID=UPI001E68E945|nr:uncharacterized protein LOC123876706 [Maniola jurtina]XP_045778976.1 uncharacterized protein LOC123876706 [Maniola jurtina]